MSPSISKLDFNLMFEDSKLGNLIREKAIEIELNMMPRTPTVNSNIDMSLIESLKNRRKEKQVKGKALDMMRENTIS